MKKGIIIFISCLLLIFISALGTYFLLLQTGSIVGEKINVSFTLSPKTKEFDGTIYAYQDADFVVTEGTLLAGDTATFNYTNQYFLVGEYSINYTVTIYNEDMVDVTDSYNVQCNPGTLTITKRPLNVVITNDDLENGLIGIDDYYLYDSSLIAGHHLTVTSIEDEIVVDVVDDSGLKVTDNYNIQTGLAVAPQPLVISIDDVTHTYDGNLPTFSYRITSGTLESGDRLELNFDSLSSNINVGTYTIDPTQVRVLNTEDEDISDNYDITIITGTLKIVKASLNVVGVSAKLEYSNESVKIADGYASQKGLIPGHSLTVKYASVDSVSVGTYEIKIAEITVLDNDGKDVTNNYDISSTNGTLEILPISLTINMASNLRQVYNGTINDFSLNELVNYDQNKLLPGDRITSLYYDKSLVEAEVGNYPLYLKYITITNDLGEDVTKNYNISSTPGQLIITSANLIINGLKRDFSYTYGTDFNISATDLLYDGLVETEQITLIYDLSDVDFVNKQISGINYTIKILAAGKDVTKNYNISKSNLSFSFSKAKLTIAGYVDSKNYDGQNYVLSNKYASVTGLVVGDYITKVSYEPLDMVNVGTYTPEISGIIINNASGDDVTSFYDIDMLGGNITINPRPATIGVNSMTLTYNLAEDYPGYYTSSGLLTGDIAKYDEVKLNIGNNLITPQNVKIYRDTLDVTANYAITIYSGTITLEKMPIKINIADASKLYLGANPEFNSSIDNNELVFEITYIDYTNYLVGTYPIAYTNLKVYSSTDNQDVTKYLDIEVNSGNIEVQKINLDINIKPVSITYGEKLVIDSDMYHINNQELEDKNLTFEFSLANELIYDTQINQTLNYHVYYQNEDVTSCFNNPSIDIILSSIMPRKLDIIGLDVTKTFDNKAYQGAELEDNYLLANNLLASDKLLISYSSDEVNVGTYALDAKVKIVNASGRDVSSYYVFNTRGLAKLTILPYQLTQTDLQLEMPENSIYGERSYYNEIKQTTVLECQLNYLVGYLDNNNRECIPHNVGEYKMYVKELVGNGANNFLLPDISVSFSIDKAELNIMPNSSNVQFIYSGQLVSYYSDPTNYNFTAQDSILNMDIKYVLDSEESLEENLIDGQPFMVGTYQVTLEGVNFVDASVAQNYNIGLPTDPMTLTISPRKLYVRVENVYVSSSEQINEIIYIPFSIEGDLGANDEISYGNMVVVASSVEGGINRLFVLEDQIKINHLLSDILDGTSNNKYIDVKKCYEIDTTTKVGSIIVLN